MRFFERFRQDLGRYADGVHQLGAPAPEPELAATEARLGRALPPAYRQLLASYNGLSLFHDTVTLQPAAELRPSAIGLEVGEAPEGVLHLDPAGRVLAVDENGDRLVMGSTLEAWLRALMAREALLVDAQGEWRDVFADDGALKPEVRRRRFARGERADPRAAAWVLEEAELMQELGDVARAERALERAVGLDPGAGAAWALLGGFYRNLGKLGEAARDFERAAQASGDAGRRALRFAEAARAAAAVDDAQARARLATLARDADPQIASGLVETARRRLEAGEHADAGNLLALAEAIEPGGEAAALSRQARLKLVLRTI